MAYTQIATIATDDHHTLQEFRASVGAQWPFLPSPGRTVQQDLDIAEYTDPEHNPMIPHTLVKPGLVIHSVYNGYWFWGRPSFDPLWHDLRAATKETRPDWDLEHPGPPRSLGRPRLLEVPRLGPARSQVGADVVHVTARGGHGPSPPGGAWLSDRDLAAAGHVAASRDLGRDDGSEHTGMRVARD